ncbi:MAG: gliding motility-associated C-terminal domain-containing protein, partial [Saprospiraceae bacterium]|nr:gliding motility-associated C-terminal domain-containing protein [Saprospiraceae bacterium]
TPQVSVAGTYTVTVRATNGCTNTATVTVVADQQPPQGVSTTGATLTCAQPTRTITATSTTAGVTYSWTGPNNFTSALQTPTVSTGGTYTVVITSPSNGCSTSATATVQTDQQPPSVTAQGGIVTCAAPSLALTATSNPVNVSWAWTGPGGFNSTQQSPQATAAGVYTLTVTNPANGCTASATATVVSDQQPPQLTIPAPGLLTCNTTQVNVTVQVSPTGSYTYQWTTQGGVISSGANSATAVATAAGQYAVLVTSQQNGCTATAATQVVADSATIRGAQLAPKAVSCFGRKDGSVRVLSVQGGTPPYLYGIGNNALSPQMEFSALAPGSYTLNIQDVNGCEWSTTFTIGEPGELIVELGADTTIYLGDVIRINIDDVVNFPGRVVTRRLEPVEWADSLGRELRPLKSFRYSLTVVDSNGCRASDTRLVVVDKTRFVYIPNVFTPEVAGPNATFFISARYPNHVTKVKSLLIFDRWGSAVFERFNFAPNDPTQGWDGQVRGSKGLPGVYVYYAEIEFIDGETILYKGDVTIMR